MEIREGEQHALRQEHKNFIFTLLHQVVVSSSSSSVVEDPYNELFYTQCAHTIGKSLKQQFAGIWVCICGRHHGKRSTSYNSNNNININLLNSTAVPTQEATSNMQSNTSYNEQDGKAEAEQEEEEETFSFAVPGAIRYFTALVDQKHLFYIAQTYDAVVPAAQCAKQISEWNLD